MWQLRQKVQLYIYGIEVEAESGESQVLEFNSICAHFQHLTQHDNTKPHSLCVSLTEEVVVPCLLLSL